MRVRVEILGPVQLWIDGEQVQIQRNQVKRALSLLAAYAPKPVTQDQLVEHLWGDALPADPKASLRVALSRLRTTLGNASDELISGPVGYALSTQTDMDEFERALHAAQRAETDQTAIAHWANADELWSDSLDSFGDASLLEAFEGRLRRARAQSLPAHAECLFRLGRHDQALAHAAPAQSADVGNERLAIVCAQALAATGRKAAAVQLLTVTRSFLRDQLGLDPSDRFTDAEDQIVRDSTSFATSVTASSPSGRSHVFVGRAYELRKLLDAGPGLHAVVGEPGSGKTALVAAAADQRSQAGQTVLWTKATQTPTRPMESLAELLTKIAEVTPATTHPEALRSSLSRLAPELVDGPVSQPASRDGLLALTREAIEDFAATSAPVTVIIDDAQWLDRASAQVFDALIDNSALTLVATTRDSLPPNLTFLFDETRRVQVVRLEPLTRSDVETLVAQELPSLPLDATTDQLFAQSGGNALFLGLLAGLVAEGALPESALPASVLLSVQQRLASLSTQAQHTLQIASVFTNSFPIDVISELAPQADSHIEEAIAHKLVVADDEPGRYRFAHALVAEAAYQLLADGSRLELHDEIGRLLEAWGGTAAEYALHCGEAAQLDPTRAVRSHLFAAREFAASFDWDTALLHAQRGIGYDREYELPGSAIQAQLHVLAGAAMRAQGNPDGDMLLTKGVELALKFDDVDTSISGLLALCTHGRMSTPVGAEIHGQLQETLALGLSVAQRAQLLACEGALVSISPLQPQGRRAHARAFDMLKRFDDPNAHREILLRTHLGFPHPQDFGRRVEATQMLSDMAGNDPDLLWEVAFLSFGTAMVQGDTNGAEANLSKMGKLAPRIRIRQRDYGLRFSEAAWARYNNDLDHAEFLLGQAMEIGQESFSDGWTLVIYAAVMSSIREAQGRIHELLPLIDTWMQANPERPAWHVIAAACSASTGDAERAERELVWLKRDNFACLSPDLSWSAMFSFLVEPVNLVNDRAAARTLLELIEPFAGMNLWNGACIHRSADEAIAAYRLAALDEA